MRWVDDYIARSRETCWKLYEKYYGGPEYMSHMARLRAAVAPFIAPDAVVLDAGCGSDMTFAGELRPQVRRVVGIDVDRDLRRRDGTEACRGDLGRLPFRDQTFDVVVSLSVMEHVEEPEPVFREIHRVLKPGGGLVVLTPNRFDYVAIVAQVTPHWFHQWSVSRILAKPERDVFPTRYRANSKRRLTQLLRKSGMKPEQVDLFNQYPAYLMFSGALFSLGVAYERITSRYPQLAQLRGWLLAVGRKAR